VGQQSAQVKVECLQVEEFPPIPRIKGEPVPLNENIRTSLLEAFDCASTDDMRHILQGAYIDVSDKKCNQVVATDGSHLYSSNSFSLPLNESILIPTNKFLGWKEFNADGEWQLRVEPKKKDQPGFVQISSRRWRFIHRQIEGPYPNYKAVIPKADQFNTSVEVEPAATKNLIQMINRIPCDDKVNQRIGIKIVGRKVSLLSTSDGKQLEVGVPETTVKGKDVVFHLNRNYLIRAMSFELCHLQVVDELTAVKFSDNNGRQMIVMPVRAADPSAPAPAPPAKVKAPAAGESNSEAETSSTERNTMPKSTTPINGNGTNGHHKEEAQPVTIDTALEQIEIIKGSYREAIRGLNTLTDTLKQVQRDQKSSVKEIQSVRSTLEKLQSVRI